MPDDAPLLLDVTRLVWRRWKGRLPTGIDRVALAYLDHFGPRSQAVVHHERFRRILDTKASQALFALLKSPTRGFKAELAVGFLKNAGRFRCQGRGRLYLNAGHTALHSQGFRTWAQTSDLRPVYLVHDLIPITHPQFAREGEDLRHGERIRTALMTAAGIIGNSGVTLDELERFSEAERLTMPPAVVAWLGTDPLPPVVAPERPLKPTFVALGTIEARKNHLLLLNVWSRLVSRLGAHAPQLLIIGQRGWEADEVFYRLDHDITLRGHVTELPCCTDDELARHLGAAQALLFPSFAEGYGLPLVEAFAAGVPVIASDLAVFREIGGSIPAYVDPTDENAWEAAILDYASSNSVSRAAQLERIEGFTPPSWADHFSAVEAWLSGLS